MERSDFLETVVNENEAVYYTGRYWNDLDCVNQRINSRISGDPVVSWYDHFARRYGTGFERLLSLNCGNGWVERDLIERGIAAKAVGIDYSPELLAQAGAEASRLGLPIAYRQADVNRADFPAERFDLVVNHAAAHHIAWIDRVFRRICRDLPEEGLFVSLDYVGPHRNQWSYDAWESAWDLNRTLPEQVRQDLGYPSLGMMVRDDPTEAIHSELFESTLRRYFTVREFVPLGGAIAYPLLTHNRRLFDLDDADERERWARFVLEADDAYLKSHPGSSLFAFCVASPRKEALANPLQLEEWTAAETARERAAADRGGLYYDLSPYQSAVAAWQAEAEEAQRLRDLVAALQPQAEQTEALRERIADLEDHRSSWRQWRRALASRPAVRRIRSRPAVQAIEQRIRPRLDI